MKVCVLQPYYSFDESDTQKCFVDMLALLDKCDDSLDLIVMPEYSDIPAAQSSKASFHRSIAERNFLVLQKAKEAAKRCHAMVFVNCADQTESGYRNTTFAINRVGEIVGKYYKEHPAPSEVRTEVQGGNELDVSYSYSHRTPYVLEMEGLRFGFMTCYDFYFYENYAPLARENVDIIIGCSHQRTDTHDALSIINRFLCYHTNAYLVRSSVSLGVESTICGSSCVIAPDGTMLCDMKSKIGLGICEIDPKKKYYKPAGFRGKEKAHYEYIEEGRRPWLYRNGGSAIVPFESVMPYPRICAHRGFNTIAPENTMPAFGAAISLGAEEIEFDLWSTTDGVIVSCHDPVLDRVSNGTGKIYEHSYEELLALDFGAKRGEHFKGLKICTFEEILQKYAGHAIMNIHVKIWDKTYTGDRKIEEIVALIRKYDAQRHVYFMSSNDEVVRQVMEYAPDIPVCLGWNDDKEDPYSMVKRALALGVKKIQLFKPYFNEQTVRLAHENGILCNVFYADTPEEARMYRDWGIDTILTNDYLNIRNALQEK